MRILLTGSSGRIGRAIYGALAAAHDVVGMDRSPFSTTRVVADFTDSSALQRVLEGVEAVVHTASLHAPHVGVERDAQFRRINVDGTAKLLEAARQAGVSRVVYTSTTALYGDAVVDGECTWIDEATLPRPKTIYHRTKLEAEALLEAAATRAFGVRVLRMSRCFPEPPDVMALYRLHRGIDARDVGEAHAAALRDDGVPFARFIVSGATPFLPEDARDLVQRPREVLARRCPELLAEFDRRAWPVPSIDRVYDASAAARSLRWQSSRGWQEVLRQHDTRDIEVLPRGAGIGTRSPE